MYPCGLVWFGFRYSFKYRYVECLLCVFGISTLGGWLVGIVYEGDGAGRDGVVERKLK